ncbi:MAG: hypothetical protein ACREDR_05105 [Blastocatellia bacterium]
MKVLSSKTLGLILGLVLMLATALPAGARPHRWHFYVGFGPRVYHRYYAAPIYPYYYPYNGYYYQHYSYYPYGYSFVPLRRHFDRDDFHHRGWGREWRGDRGRHRGWHEHRRG